MTDGNAMPAPGQPGPDFTLPVAVEEQASLAEYRGLPGYTLAELLLAVDEAANTR
jgi:hypothetical protein